jgi:hypothetical protein
MSVRTGLGLLLLASPIDSGGSGGGNGERVTTPTPVLESVLTCPQCGHTKAEIMPLDACQFFYECEHCKTILRPLAGQCCVFCSYGSVKCPPMQRQDGCSR